MERNATAFRREIYIQPQVRLYNSTEECIPEEIVQKCASLYCQIWKEPPWNEEFWQADQVLETMKNELTRPGAVGILAAIFHPFNCLGVGCEDAPICPLECGQCTAAGFTWGYPVSQGDLREISGNNLLDQLFETTTQVFYIDELGVDKELRGQRVGTILSSLLIQTARKNGAKLIVLRTDKQAESAKRLYVRMGFQDLGLEDAQYPNRTYWTLKE